MLADAEDGHDVGVMQPRRGLGLALEPLDHLAVGARPGREDLQGHVAAQRLLDRLVNDPHPAPADLADDPIIAERLERRATERSSRCGPARRGADRRAGLFHLDQGREQLPDFLGQLGVRGDELRQGRPLPGAEPRQERLGQLLDRLAFRNGIRHGQSSLRRNSAYVVVVLA